jgi:cytochrome P450
MFPIPADGLVVDTYAEVAAALADTDLSRSLDRERYEYRSILEDVLMMLEGEDHRNRRRVENALFRRETLEQYELQQFPKIIEQTLGTLLSTNTADLLTVGAVLTVELSARTAGIDVDAGSLLDRQALVDLVDRFADGISIDAGTGDLEETKTAVRAALEAFRVQFYDRSVEVRQQATRKFESGGIAEADMPRDILTTLLQAKSSLNLRPDQLLRETAFFLEAGAHTSSQSLASSMHHIFDWADRTPEGWQRLRSDRLFVQRCVHEALRLRPTNPLIKRRAVQDTQVGNRHIEKGSLVYLNTYQANRDRAVFGSTADEFDPDRMVPATTARYGHSFGGGIHACIGRNLAIGYPIRSFDTPPADHLYGLVTLMVQALVERGVMPDPMRRPTVDQSTTRWTRWSTYPVVVGAAA